MRSTCWPCSKPIAIDLRFIMAVIKSNADLERVGNQAVNIAQRVMDLIADPQVDLPADIPEMASISAQMIRQKLSKLLSPAMRDWPSRH